MTGQIVLTNREGEVFHLDAGEAPHLAAMLEPHCTDNGERCFVREAWTQLDDEEEE